MLKYLFIFLILVSSVSALEDTIYLHLDSNYSMELYNVVNNTLSDASNYHAKIFFNDSEYYAELIHGSEGVYIFDYDFSEFSEGAVVVSATFDDDVQLFTLHLDDSYPSTAYVKKYWGEVKEFTDRNDFALIIIFGLLFFFLVVVGIYHFTSNGRKSKSNKT